MTVKELMKFLSKQNSDKNVTLTKSDYHEYSDSDRLNSLIKMDVE